MNYIYGFLLIFTLLTVFTFFKIRKGKQIAEHIYHLGFILGSFVWEDLFLLSIYFSILSGVTIYFQQIKLFLLGFVIFWLVRSLGETIYWFLQQFIVPQHHPLNVDLHFNIVRKIFGNISTQQCMVLFQVLLQIITMFSIIALIFILKNWSVLP